MIKIRRRDAGATEAITRAETMISLQAIRPAP
jgi:hypothetical protein